MVDPDAFWAWSLARYPEIEPLALRLQDEHGADVNLLLLCAYLGRLAPEALDAAERAVAPWRREVVEPLRRARRAAKGTPIYESLKAVEVEAERLAQRRLVAAFTEPQGQIDAVALYLERLGVPEPLKRAAIKAFGQG